MILDKTEFIKQIVETYINNLNIIDTEYKNDIQMLQKEEEKFCNAIDAVNKEKPSFLHLIKSWNEAETIQWIKKRLKEIETEFIDCRNNNEELEILKHILATIEKKITTGYLALESVLDVKLLAQQLKEFYALKTEVQERIDNFTLTENHFTKELALKYSENIKNTDEDDIDWYDYGEITKYYDYRLDTLTWFLKDMAKGLYTETEAKEIAQILTNSARDNLA